MPNHSSAHSKSLNSLNEKNMSQSPDLRLFHGEDSARPGEKFRSLFQRRHEYARLLLDLSTQQQELISHAQFGGLIELLLRKQTLLDALQELSQGEPPLLQQWENNRNLIPETVREECEHWLALSEQVLADLMELEQTCTSELQQKRDHTQTQLEAVSNAVHMQDAYHQDSFQSQFDRSQ